jgi:N-acetylmuramoyl-L-alanine amidase
MAGSTGRQGDSVIRRAVLALAVLLAAHTTPAAAVEASAAVTPVVETAAALPRATDARIAGDAQKTRFILDVEGPVTVNAFTLGDPYRVVLDLPEVEFGLAADAGLTGRGLVSGWRYGLFARGRSRIVLDVSGPVAIEAAFVVPSADGVASRLVVDLVASTPEAFRAELLRTASARAGANEVPLVKADRLPAPGEDDGKPIVVLDPGHGGVDAGTTTEGGVMEKDVVLAFALDVKHRLEASGRVTVVMTREDDRFIPLGERVRFAREQKARLFVSIHADSAQQDFVRGATVYTNAERATDAAAAALALKENAADAVAGLEDEAEKDEIMSILADLTRRETKTFSRAAADHFVRELSSTTQMIRNPHRAASFMVLKAPDVPSVLVEIGYLSNDEDAKLLTSEDFRARVATAVGEAILRFFGHPQSARAG